MPTRFTGQTRTNKRARTRAQGGTRPLLDLSVQFAVRRSGLPTAARFGKWARAALIETATVALRLVNRAEALMLNATYRQRHYATNVLTFAYPDTCPLSGDMVLCVPVIREEAHRQGKPLHAHLAHLTVHGMLHLQGFEHDSDEDAELMEGIETEIVSALGYADPYAIPA